MPCPCLNTGVLSSLPSNAQLLLLLQGPHHTPSRQGKWLCPPPGKPDRSRTAQSWGRMGQETRAERKQVRPEGPAGSTRSLGSHLKCQQQEERFDAVETAIHKVPHEEVVGLRDITTHLVGGVEAGRFWLVPKCPTPRWPLCPSSGSPLPTAHLARAPHLPAMRQTHSFRSQ